MSAWRDLHTPCTSSGKPQDSPNGYPCPWNFISVGKLGFDTTVNCLVKW